MAAVQKHHRTPEFSILRLMHAGAIVNFPLLPETGCKIRMCDHKAGL